MKKVFITTAILLLCSSCYFGEQRAEQEIRELQTKLDSIENCVNNLRDFISNKKDELLYITIDGSDECSDNFKDDVSYAINEMLDEVGYRLSRIEDETYYNDYDFDY